MTLHRRLEVEIRAESHDSRIKQAQYVVIGRYDRRWRGKRLVDDENRIAVKNIEQVKIRLKRHRFADIERTAKAKIELLDSRLSKGHVWKKHIEPHRGCAIQARTTS